MNYFNVKLTLTPILKFLQNICRVITFTDYLADDFLRLETLTKTYFAVSVCLASCVTSVSVFLLHILMFATCIGSDANITAGHALRV
jgi:hypothetical protein